MRHYAPLVVACVIFAGLVELLVSAAPRSSGPAAVDVIQIEPDDVAAAPKEPASGPRGRERKRTGAGGSSATAPEARGREIARPARKRVKAGGRGSRRLSGARAPGVADRRAGGGGSPAVTAPAPADDATRDDGPPAVPGPAGGDEPVEAEETDDDAPAPAAAPPPAAADEPDDDDAPASSAVPVAPDDDDVDVDVEADTDED